MQACAFDPITSFGILARPRVCLTIVTLGLPWVPRLSPKENGHLPCLDTPSGASSTHPDYCSLLLSIQSARVVVCIHDG